MNTLRKQLTALYKWLYTWDGVWSIPLSIGFFLVAALAGQAVFGESFGFFGPEFLHAAVLSIMVLVVFNCSTHLWAYFNFRALLREIQLFKSTFKTLPVWQRLCLSLLCYFIVLALHVAIFIAVV